MNHRQILRDLLFAAGITIFLAACSYNYAITPRPPAEPPAPSALPATRLPASSTVTGSVQIEEGRCCMGGTAGSKLQAQVQFTAQSSAGPVRQMRVSPGGGGCAGEARMETAPWEPFEPSKAYPVTTTINWIGFYVSAQFRDEAGNVSPVYCDDISVEGSPAMPAVNPTEWYAQIQCFDEKDVYPSQGEVVSGPTVTFRWPDTNQLPEGVFYQLSAYGESDHYTALAASGQTRDTSLTLSIPAARAGDIVWYITLVDANGAFLDHGRCSSFPPSLLTVNPPEGIKGVHFAYMP